MNTKVVVHQYKLQKWTSLIQECRNSGMKVIDWCTDNNISKNTYYYWFKEVRKAACESIHEIQKSEPCFVQVQSNNIMDLPNHNKEESEIRITIGGATVEVTNHTSPETLRMVLGVLAHAQ